MERKMKLIEALGILGRLPEHSREAEAFEVVMNHLYSKMDEIKELTKQLTERPQ